MCGKLTFSICITVLDLTPFPFFIFTLDSVWVKNCSSSPIWNTKCCMSLTIYPVHLCGMEVFLQPWNSMLQHSTDNVAGKSANCNNTNLGKLYNFVMELIWYWIHKIYSQQMKVFSSKGSQVIPKNIYELAHL